MVNLLKLSKDEIKATGFKNRVIASKFLKDIIKKQARAYKTKDDLLLELKTNFNKFKKFGIDLNLSHKIVNKAVNRAISIPKEVKTNYEKLLENPQLESIDTELNVDQYLKNENYKKPDNKFFRDKSKKLKATYYYEWSGIEGLINTVQELYMTNDTAFKFNVSFAYLLQNINDRKKFKYFSAQYNTKLFDYPETISNRSTLTGVINQINQEFSNYKDQKIKRPNSQWKFYKFLHYEISVFRLETTIGAKVSLPLHFFQGENFKNIVKFENYDDNLCFWRCLAAFLNPDKAYHRLERISRDLYYQYYQVKYNEEYEGVKYLEYKKYLDLNETENYEKSVDELDKIENHFKINIMIYTQDNTEHEKPVTEIDRRSINTYGTTLYLMRYDKHFCFIKEIERFVHSFKCTRCGKLWANATACHRHEKTCGEFCKHQFPGGFCSKTKSIFERLPENITQHKFYDPVIVYDFEAMLIKHEDIRTDSLKFTSKHIPVSFSLFSNIPGYDIEPIFECCNDPKELIDMFVQHLVKISAKAYEINYEKYKNVIEYLDEDINKNKGLLETLKEDGNNDKLIYKTEGQLNYVTKQKENFMKWMREVPVIGFNSAKYDANIMKMYLNSSLDRFDKNDNEEVQVLKTNTMYRVLTSKSLKFLDVSNFLAGGCSLDSWLKAYQCKMTKGFFPYEWLDNYDKLNQDHLPEYELWFSSLKNKNIGKEDYNVCVEAWNNNNMKSMKDFLKWYNNCDVIPMIEAIDKMFIFYRSKGLDMFKDAVSLPGLAYKMLLSSTENKFSLFEEEDKDLYYTLKKNIVGGPSIIFHRYHEAGKTKIRGNKLCMRIVGYDANALYLCGISLKMPTGKYIRIPTYSLQKLKFDVMNDKFFGFVECDISVPDHLKSYFEEMTPIFKNIEITPNKEIIGDHMYEYAKFHDIPMNKSRKLIGSYFGEKILIYTPLLKWYYEHGLVVTKFYQGIQYEGKECFANLAEDIANARRSGDTDKSKAIIAETMKLIGNALYGRTVMDKERHTSTSYCGLDKISKKINNPHFKDLEQLNDNRFEVTSGKCKINMDTPIQIGCAVYQLAKLRMLEFYYDCLDKYIDRSDFQMVEMDTDSAYMALSSEKFEDLIKPEMKEEFERDKYNWFPRTDTKENIAYDKRKPGLFKEEFSGKSIYALCSKLYFVEGDDKNKYSCKGIQHNQNTINKERFDNVLFHETKDMCINKGFRVINNEMVTYIQHKKGLSYMYDKRKVLADGVSTVPLEI